MLDPSADQQSIIERAKTLLGGRIYDGIPDETRLERDATTGVLKPYAVIWFGELFPSDAGDRSITGEEQQPYSMSVLVDVWAESATTARQAIGPFHALFIGWSPSDNMSTLTARGSGSFAFHQITGAPTRFNRTLTLEATINNSVQIGS